jgi:hypothetical protein
MTFIVRCDPRVMAVRRYDELNSNTYLCLAALGLTPISVILHSTSRPGNGLLSLQEPLNLKIDLFLSAQSVQRLFI